jgi:hypothetical protein
MATQIGWQEILFGEYELDLQTGELRRNGDILKLQPQPAKVLTILIRRWYPYFIGESCGIARDLIEQVNTISDLFHELEKVKV